MLMVKIVAVAYISLITTVRGHFLGCQSVGVSAAYASSLYVVSAETRICEQLTEQLTYGK